MQPFYNEQQQMLAATVREFAENDLAPLADDVDTNEEFPKAQFAALAELGLTGLLTSEELGGAGMGYRDFMVVLEEIGAVCGSTSTVLITHTSLGSETINRFGTDEQRARWMPSLAAGEKIAAFALTEPQTGSDALGLQTTIVDDGDSYILNGTKLFITNASVADVFAVFVTADRAAGYRGISAIVVERGSTGFEINEQHGKMGMRGSGTAELVFTDCRVPKSHLLENVGDGYSIALKILDSSRITVAAQCLGLAKGALDQSVAYAKQRIAFGRPIATKQAIQFMLADMSTELDAARLMVYRAASLYDEGLPYGVASAKAKLYASEVAGRNVNKAVQIHGGIGYFKPTPVERMYRDQRVTEIYEGTSEIQRLVISRDLIGDM
jgi:butyryl-CoA dehydrogenase